MSRPPIENVAITGWCLLLFVATLYLHTRHNDFPWYYHPDEPGKVEQVLGIRAWNFHHPMLLLSTTKLAVTASGAHSEQSTVEIGRSISAFFTAIAIVAFSLLAWMTRGRCAAITTGLVLMLHHQLFELSHYMKEDSALLLGVALTFLAGFYFEKAPSTPRAALLGLACGLAISGKYLGVITLIVPLVILGRAKIKKAWFALILALILTFTLINLPLLSDWQTFLKSFERESRLVVEGQGAITQSVPHSRYWSIFLTNTTPAMWLLIALSIMAIIRHRRLLSTMEWMLAIFPFAYAVTLSFSPKDNDRYFLPASAVFALLSVAGISFLADLLREKFPPLWTKIIASAVLVAAQFPDWTEDRAGLARYFSAFQHDDTAELVQWIRANIPPDAVLAKDDKVRLPTLLRHGREPGTSLLPQKILTDTHVADIGSFEELRERGVTHIITTPSTYQKFDRAGLRPKKTQKNEFAQRKLFYTTLRRDFDDPVWQSTRSTVIYLHPGLEMYCIKNR